MKFVDKSENLGFRRLLFIPITLIDIHFQGCSACEPESIEYELWDAYLREQYKFHWYDLLGYIYWNIIFIYSPKNNMRKCECNVKVTPLLKLRISPFSHDVTPVHLIIILIECIIDEIKIFVDASIAIYLHQNLTKNIAKISKLPVKNSKLFRNVRKIEKYSEIPGKLSKFVKILPG